MGTRWNASLPVTVPPALQAGTPQRGSPYHTKPLPFPYQNQIQVSAVWPNTEIEQQSNKAKDRPSAAKEHKERIAKETDSIHQGVAHDPYPSPQLSPDFPGRPESVSINPVAMSRGR